METALALVLPLVAGSLYVRGLDGLRYHAAREDGHRLYFRIAYHGLVLFVMGLALVLAVDRSLDGFAWFDRFRAGAVDVVAPLLKDEDNAEGQTAFLAACLLSVLIGRLWPVLSNSVFRARHEAALWRAAEQDQLEELLLDALARAKTIAATLTSGKVYVGYVLTTPEPRADRRFIALLPIISGYRQEPGGKVVFTTFYDRFYEGDVADASEDFRLVLPVDKIASFSFFDVQVYARFNEPEADPDTAAAGPAEDAPGEPAG